MQHTIDEKKTLCTFKNFGLSTQETQRRGVQCTKDERKVLRALIVLGALNSMHKKQRGAEGGGGLQHTTDEKKTFGTLGAMDFRHKKHKVKGGGAPCNILKKHVTHTWSSWNWKL